MRYKASLEAGLEEIYIIKAEDLTDEQQREFIIKDNVGFGEWDWDQLANEWDTELLNDWGLDVWQPEEDVDYSILEDEDFSSDLEDMKNGVKKAIQIPFELEHYEEAFELIKYWREQGGYVGMMLIEKLKQEKTK
jgi:ParB-like chromosome segregation protein Spo0J